MADQKSTLEREYIIPLRRAWLKAPRYERMRIAIRTIRRFIAKHMKIPDRDLKKVKLDVFFNNDLWFRGTKKPPAKVRVKAIKENDIVRVNFVEIPQHVKFLKQKLDKFHKPAKKKPETKEEKPKEEIKTEEIKKTEEKPEEKKIEEKEKEQAVAEQHAKEAKQEAKAQKHLTKAKEPGFHRMALKK